MKVIKTRAERFIGSQAACDGCGSIIEIEAKDDILDYETKKGMLFEVTLAIAQCPTCGRYVKFGEKEDEEEDADD